MIPIQHVHTKESPTDPTWAQSLCQQAEQSVKTSLQTVVFYRFFCLPSQTLVNLPICTHRKFSNRSNLDTKFVSASRKICKSKLQNSSFYRFFCLLREILIPIQRAHKNLQPVQLGHKTVIASRKICKNKSQNSSFVQIFLLAKTDFYKFTGLCTQKNHQPIQLGQKFGLASRKTCKNNFPKQ